jgi:heat shock protein HslJ
MKLLKYIKRGIALTLVLLGLSFVFPSPSYATTLEGIVWTLKSGLGPVSVPNTEITAEFNNGQLTGSGGCNQYGANYTAESISETSGKIQIQQIRATRKACGEAIDAQEQKYFQALEKVREYRLSDRGLVLPYPSPWRFLLFTQKQALNLPEEVANAVLQAASERTLEIIEVEEQIWPDGCLGLGGPNEICTQALVPGFRVTVKVAGVKLLIYRTDESGSQIRLEKEVALK